MFKVDTDNNRIYITKGDSGTIAIKVYDLDGKEQIVGANDILKMSVKKPGISTPVISLIAENNHFIFLPNTTKNLANGNYIYDVEIKTEDNLIFTLIDDGLFLVRGEVTQ